MRRKHPNRRPGTGGNQRGVARSRSRGGTVVRYLASAVPWPYPAEAALQFCRDYALPAIERGEQWIWTVRLKSDPNRLLGLIALATTPDNNRGF
ncbi:MAG: hypothetical protein ABI051_04110 [Vicinamibacterales bacterium]